MPPCPHFDLKIVQRSKRQSAVAAAAYGRMIEIYCASRSAACNPQAVRGHFGNPALASR